MGLTFRHREQGPCDPCRPRWWGVAQQGHELIEASADLWARTPCVSSSRCPSPLLCARMGALFSLLGLAVCWPAPRCVRGVLALGTCVDPTRAATGMVCRCLGAVALHGGGGRNRIAGVGRGSGADTDGTALRHFATSNYAACTTTACPPSQPLPFAANARSNRSGDEFSPPPTSTSIAPHDVTTWPRGALLTGRSVARQTRASGLNKETRIARLRKPWPGHRTHTEVAESARQLTQVPRTMDLRRDGESVRYMPWRRCSCSRRFHRPAKGRSMVPVPRPMPQ